MRTEKHIINKMYLEVNTTSKEQGYRIKDNLDSFLKEEVFPAIENKLKTLEKQVTKKILRIDKLDFEIELKSDFKLIDVKQKIVTGIQNSIEEQFQKSKGQSMLVADKWSLEESLEFFSTDSNAARALIYFLEKGTSPWWGNKELFSFLFDEDVLEEILHTKSLASIFYEKLKQKNIRKRFIQQFSDIAIKKTLNNIFKTLSTTVLNPQKLDREFEVFLTSVSLELRFEIWDVIIQFFQTNNIQEFYKSLSRWKNILTREPNQNEDRISDSLDEIDTRETKESIKINRRKSNWIESVIKSIDSQFPEIQNKISQDTKSIQNTVQKTSKDTIEIQFNKANKYAKKINKNEELEINEEGYYIKNAGLVLVHPFLKNFFEHCKLINDQNKISDPELAIHLLHYLATKQEKQPEHQMIFEKFLCNIPLHLSINRNIEIAQEFKMQSEELLEAMTQNWGALKNASSDLMRNEFLQRPGKLILNGNNPKIIVERKTQDILLDRLPWNISIVKLPWKDKLIFVDW